MTTAVITIRGDTDRKRAHKWIDAAPHGCSVTFKTSKRTADQNARLWSCLGDIARQVVWHGQKLQSDDWKMIFLAALRKCRIVPGIDGGFVPIGMRSSALSKQEFSDLLELINAFAAEHGVIFQDSTPQSAPEEGANAA